jgi:hypothetical protein
MSGELVLTRSERDTRQIPGLSDFGGFKAIDSGYYLRAVAELRSDSAKGAAKAAGAMKAKAGRGAAGKGAGTLFD